jgi:hypothetical protein
MCEPLSLAAAAGSIAAAGINYMGQQDTMAAQQQANDDWVAYQRAQAAKAAAADEANRKKATAAEQTTLQNVSPANQEANQQKSQADLTNQMLVNNPAGDQNVKLLSGEAENSNTDVSSELSARVTNAAREARSRIAALAGLSSYGTGYGGMTQQANTDITSGNQDIALTSDLRKGDTATLGVAQQVPVLQYTQGSNIAGGIASGLASIAGSAFGSKMKAA